MMLNENTPSIPDGLTHRQLAHLFDSAISEPSFHGNDSGEVEQLNDEIREWTLRSQNLLHHISKQADALGEQRSAQQLMALGSFRTHVMFALQALKASQI